MLVRQFFMYWKKSISFLVKYFLFRKTNLLMLASFFIRPFSPPNTDISIHTQNMIIKVLKTWKFELSVLELLGCFIPNIFSFQAIIIKKGKKILIRNKNSTQYKAVKFPNMQHLHCAQFAVQNNNSRLYLPPTRISSLNINIFRGSKFQSSFSKKTKENKKIEKVHSTVN